jgi:hypothetical protein
MEYYYVHYNSVSVFVKAEDYFIERGGLTENWGKNWRKIEAKSIEDAREKGYILFGAVRTDAQRAVGT